MASLGALGSSKKILYGQNSDYQVCLGLGRERVVFLTRRTLLVGGLSAGAASFMTFGVGTLTPATGCVVLAEQEYAIVRAIAEAMFPRIDSVLHVTPDAIARAVDQILDEVLDEPAAFGFRAVLRSLEWGSYASRAKRFSRISVAERREILDVWGSPGVLPRLAAAASLKAVLGMAYFGHADVRRSLGWRAVCEGSTS